MDSGRQKISYFASSCLEQRGTRRSAVSLTNTVLCLSAVGTTVCTTRTSATAFTCNTSIGARKVMSLYLLDVLKRKLSFFTVHTIFPVK